MIRVSVALVLSILLASPQVLSAEEVGEKTPKETSIAFKRGTSPSYGFIAFLIEKPIDLLVRGFAYAFDLEEVDGSVRRAKKIDESASATPKSPAPGSSDQGS